MMIEINSGPDLEQAVARVGRALGLDVETQVVMGDRIWGPRRCVDVVFSHPTKALMLGVECRYQARPSTDEERIPLLLHDVAAWPISGIVVLHGDGFSPGFETFVRQYGHVVKLEDLTTWLQLHFHLPLDSE